MIMEGETDRGSRFASRIAVGVRALPASTRWTAWIPASLMHFITGLNVEYARPLRPAAMLIRIQSIQSDSGPV